MPHNPEKIRVVARATAIIRDEQDRFLLNYHPKQDHYFLVGGKAKYTEGPRAGKDIAEEFEHTGRANAFAAHIFKMKRESARAAGIREVWEELRWLQIVSDMRWTVARKQFRFRSPLPGIEIFNFHDVPHGGYRPRIDTKNIILPCEMSLPRRWAQEVQDRWVLDRDMPGIIPIVWYANVAEILNLHTTRGLKISPDVRHILLRLGFIPPIESVYGGSSEEATNPQDDKSSFAMIGASPP